MPNASLERRCLARLDETAGHDRAPIGERLLADLAAFRSLPGGVGAAAVLRRDAAQLLDRLTHHFHILEMNGESYRLEQFAAAAAEQSGRLRTRPRPPWPT